MTTSAAVPACDDTSAMPGSFFTHERGERFRPTDHARGPWHPEHCHAGPPTGLVARALERLVPDKRLTRLTLNLMRPIPHAGFRIRATLARDGRIAATSRAEIVADDGRVVASAEGLHLLSRPAHPYPTRTDSIGSPDDARPGPFPIPRTVHGLPSFLGPGVETRYPDGENGEPGPTIAWLRTVPLLPDEIPSPFQRICPLADCGNAFGRNADPPAVTFANADLTLTLHRDPLGEWLGARAIGFWEADGIGMSEAALFDLHGRVGLAVQTLVLTAPDAN